MDADTLNLLAGALLSLAFSYLPGLSGWYERLGQGTDGQDDGGARKRLVMLGLLALAAGGAFGLACSGWGAFYGLALTCDQRGLAGLLQGLVLALIANQGTYALTPKRSRFANYPVRR